MPLHAPVTEAITIQLQRVRKKCKKYPQFLLKSQIRT